jgi:hypothetical protein
MLIHVWWKVEGRTFSRNAMIRGQKQKHRNDIPIRYTANKTEIIRERMEEKHR